MYPPDYPRDDSDDCGCRGYGHSCDYHKAESERRRKDTEAEWAAKGMDPYASVDGLEGIMFEVMSSPALSQNQKDAIMRILFPAKRI